MIGLCYEILIKKEMLMKFCAKNYETTDGFVNGADGIFEDFTKTISKYFVWIHFHNHRIEHSTQINFFQIYDEFSRFDKQWTPIEPKITEIQIVISHYHENLILNSISCNTNYALFIRVDF
jgi:hypothetical protein